MEHISFNKRKTIRNNLDWHLKISTKEIDDYKKQSFSSQRLFIKPKVFKKISLNYLENISYFKRNNRNPFFRTIK